MIGRAEISRAARKAGVLFNVVEKDYCLGWLLKGLAARNPMSDWVFKGGTALKKCYFADWRFSADLDFTGTGRAPARGDLEQALIQAVAEVTAESGVRYSLQGVELTRSAEGEEALVAKVFFVGPSMPRTIQPVAEIHLSYFEEVVNPPEKREIIHPYSDAFQQEIWVYSLEEILGEKLRAILQQRNRIPRPRDFYDVWRLFREKGDIFDPLEVKKVFLEKCRFKQVEFGSPRDFFDSGLMERNQTAWRASVKNQIKNVPEFEEVITELKSSLFFLDK